MDKKANEAGLDREQWDRSVKDAFAFKDRIGSTFTIFHTIEPYKLFVRLEMKEGPSRIMEMTDTDACRTEFPKCEILAETVFKR